MKKMACKANNVQESAGQQKKRKKLDNLLSDFRKVAFQTRYGYP
jgi:hypothetical protein